MIEIRNKQRGPIQLMVKSRMDPRQFTTRIVPGVGAGKNVCCIDDEVMTDAIESLARKGLIETRYLANRAAKGEKYANS